MVNGTQSSSNGSNLRICEGTGSCCEGGFGIGGGGLLEKGRNRARLCESDGSFDGAGERSVAALPLLSDQSALVHVRLTIAYLPWSVGGLLIAGFVAR